MFVNNQKIESEVSKYRPEIDGLRAIAVLAVVFFHARLFGFSGGYVGVDVFFVISGFLITSIIVNEIEKGTFSLAIFWERRIRRIFPALFTTLLGTTLVSFFIILYPQDFKDIGLSLVYQAFFLSNILFLRRDNYFDSAADNNPFLHTWSLSVEEQFYIIFPILMLIGAKFFWSKINKIILLLGSISLILSVWMVNFVPHEEIVTFFPFIPETLFNHALNISSAFYLIFTRAWELGVGSVLALSLYNIQSKKIAEALGFIGIGAISISVFVLSSETPFPGIIALLPVLGTATVIASTTHHATCIKKILSQKHLVKVGLISYSLYLWHWPVLVFGRTFAVRDLHLLETLGLIIISFLLAYLSYHFIETPFRTKKIFGSRKGLLSFAFVGFLLIISVGISVRASDGLTQRLTYEEKELFKSTQPLSEYQRECLSFNFSNKEDKGPCKFGDNSASTTLVVWGDSIAGSLLSMFERHAKEQNYSGILLGRTGCPPLPGVEQSPRSLSCEVMNDYALNYIRDNNIETVVLIASWNMYVSGDYFGNLEFLISDIGNPQKNVDNSKRVFDGKIRSLVSLLTSEGKNVVIFLQVPAQWYFDVRKDFYKLVFNRESYVSSPITIHEHQDYQKRVNEILSSLPNDFENVTVIDPAILLCSENEVCKYENKGVRLYRDYTHLTDDGALYLYELLEKNEINK